MAVYGWALAGCLLWLLVACHHEKSVGQRLIEDEATELLTDERLFTVTEVFDWTFSSQADLEGWTPIDTPAPTIHPRPHGMILQTADGTAVIERRLDFDTTSTHAIEITLAYPHPASLGLAWATHAKAGIPNTPRLRLRPDEGTIGKDRIYTFDLRSVADWSGEIAGLRFFFSEVGGPSRVVRRIRGLRYVVSPNDFAELWRRPWKVDLDHDVRHAWLAPPGEPREHQLSTHSGDTLRFAYGTTAEPVERVVFRVLADEAPQRRVLFEGTVEPGQGRRWHTGLADLPAAPELRLVFETTTRSDPAPHQGLAARGLPVWGHPEVVPRHQGSSAPSVLLISVDTLRPDHLSLNGHSPPTSPHLDAWARRHGVVFDQAIAPAPWTLPSHVSMLTGLDAPRHGVNYSRATAQASLTTLAEHLRVQGWSTAAITGGGWFHPRFGLGQGFDRYHYWPAHDRDQELERGVAMATVAFSELPRPFFLFLHTFAVHDFRRQALAEGGSPADDRRLYDRYVADADAILGRLFDAIDDAGLRGELLVVFTSDHGESFGGDRPPGHGYLFENNLLVPLIVEFPDQRGAGSRIARQVRSVDIVPTVLEALGLPVPEDLDGGSLLPTLDGQPAPDDLAISYAAEGNHGLALRLDSNQQQTLKYTLNNSAWPGRRGHETLFDLNEDPQERRNLAAEHRLTPQLRATARQWLAETPGLRVRFTNETTGELSFKLRAPETVISRHAVKSIDLPCDCAHRDGSSELTLTVPPATRFELILEHWDDDRLEITARTGDAPPFHLEIRPNEIHEPAAWQWTGSSWLAGEPGVDVSTGIEISRRGEATINPAPTDTDEDVRRSLRTLGYLD